MTRTRIAREPFFLFWLLILPLAARGQDAVVNRVLGDWDRRQRNIGSLRCKAAGKVLYAAGCYHDSGFPPKDTWLNRNATWVLDFRNNRMWREVDEDIFEFRRDEPVVNRRLTIDASDGSEITHSLPRDKNPSPVNPWRINHADVALTGDHYRNLCLQVEDYPLFIACGVIPTNIRLPDPLALSFSNRKEDFVVYTTAAIGTVDCLVLRTTANPDDEIVECWIDTAKESAVLKWCTLARNGIPIAIVDLQYDAAVLPKAWTVTKFQHYSAKPEERRFVETSQIMNVASFELNPVVDKEIFRIKPNPGQTYWDSHTKQLFRVKEDGSMQEYNPKASSIPDYASTWYWAIGFALLAMIGVAYARRIGLLRRNHVPE